MRALRSIIDPHASTFSPDPTTTLSPQPYYTTSIAAARNPPTAPVRGGGGYDVPFARSSGNEVETGTGTGDDASAASASTSIMQGSGQSDVVDVAVDIVSANVEQDARASLM